MNPTLDATHVAAINQISEFLACAQSNSLLQHPPVDVIVLCGNSILPIAEHVFTALEANPDLARYLVICGGVGHSTDYLYRAVAAHPMYRSISNTTADLPEAQVLHAILDKFYASASITQTGLKVLVEDKSTNCGANAIEARKTLDAAGVTDPKSMVIVQDPTMSIRTLAAFQKVYSDHATPPHFQTCPTFVPKVKFGEDGELDFDVPGLKSTSLWPMPRFLDLVMGELPRLRDNEHGYGPNGKGFIAHVDIPTHVEDTFKQLESALANRREVTIVGAGIAGLSTALALSHSPLTPPPRITLLESAPHLAEIGAGIQLTPQAVKYLFSFGVRDRLLARSIVPGAMHIRAGKTGEVLGSVDVPGMEREYGAPYIVVHRAVLHAILCERCAEVGVRVRTGCQVVGYRWAVGEVVLRGGEVVRGKLVVAADGINGAARASLLGDGEGETDARPTGWAAYRLMASVERMRGEEALKGLLEGRASHLWVEDGASCMTYLVKDATMLNIVLSHRDDRNTEGYGPEEYREAVDTLMAPFESRVQKLMDIAKDGKIVNYPVWAVPKLERWTHESGRGVILGDGAHAMAFWLSMGVSLAVEDGVALTKALELAYKDVENIQALSDNEKGTRLKMAVAVFEKARKPRAEKVAEASLHSGTILHLPEGAGREVRDDSLKYSSMDWIPRNEEPDEHRYAYGIANKKIRDWCYGFDVKEDVRRKWQDQVG
ncbi:uncharacterized protein HMPREF1541_07837 [Cyphellophora europaea CBS 101466]|uniref:FAD-binding domain-containing protein n=1 Tax=Cyphellophora europaea (strain CBS 101466) TaxID=1220924 RepID=W2RKJ9_CYPE1|nr:uncharacterized protein HMPREF1541_07837 [Cyphellophora europaea CBS 101466]ETN36850.1 hypothetical protein HMPREF1541_07837 [Cyphellophora europaea CBS 101466]